MISTGYSRPVLSMTAASGRITTVYLNMEGYTYEPSDIVNVYANGLMLIPGMDYTIEPGNPARVVIDLASQTSMRRIHIRVFKNVIGNPSAGVQTIESNSDITITGGISE